MLSPEDERDLHQRLLDGDLAATERCLHAYYEPVFAGLARRHSEVKDEALLQDAVTEALFNYVERPQTYQPARMRLVSYLVMSANGDLLNLINRERGRQRRSVSLEAVELVRPAGNDVQEDDQMELPAGVTRQQVLAAFEERFKDPLDRELVRMIYIDEIRDTIDFARLLGFEHLESPAIQDAVKKHKDRIKKMVQRLGGRFRGPATS